jgi:hypothetical protein
MITASTAVIVKLLAARGISVVVFAVNPKYQTPAVSTTMLVCKVVQPGECSLEYKAWQCSNRFDSRILISK